MPACGRCGEDNPARARFCLACGGPLAPTAPRGDERKVVSVLFCDLVGFTSRAEQLDIEDVRGVLRPYYARLRRELERYGGTVEKFIGDAVMALFGAPVAREDDPERAVRAALAIREAIAELNQADPSLGLHVRVGVTTGEALVALDARPVEGEGMASGDVVNTAARLQAAAPIDGILVDARTRQATRRRMAYRDAEPVRAKGKATPVPAWELLEARANLGMDLPSATRTPLVGRDRELGLLRDALARVRAERAPRLITLVGVPGIGKSRLVWELGELVEADPDLIVWRLGRCLPYGDGVALWALGEIVKAQTGILETDPADVAAGKLTQAVADLLTDPSEAAWVVGHLRALVGLVGGAGAGGGRREEAFAAWRRFVTGLAEPGPAVLVIEDLHWADDVLLDFLEQLIERAGEVALLVVATARPELLTRRPGWAGATPGSAVVELPALSDQDTAELVGGLLDQARLPAELQRALLARAGGNPLYAEEYVRMLADQGLLRQAGSGWRLDHAAQLPPPATVHGIIAARLDALPAQDKALLQDAAVLGEVGWLGGLAALTKLDRARLEARLRDLERRELVRRERRSRVAGERQYAFRHALVRDVAYAQIPRLSRAERHLAAAAWIEEAAVDRVEDHAEVLAHHYTQAMRLAGAAGRPGEVERLRPPALRFLVMAGDRALGLNVGRAQAHYSEALELVPPEHGQRPTVLLKWAEAARQTGRIADAVRALEEAVDGFRALGDRVAAGRAMGTLSSVLNAAGSQRHARVAAEAVRLLEEGGAGPEDLVAAYARMAGVALVVGDMRETIAWADRAAALGAGRGLEVPARALGFRGSARCALGDPAGLEELRAALALALDRGEGRDTAVLYNNLGDALLPVEGPASVLATYRQGIEFARRRGIGELAAAMVAGSLDRLIEVGAWDRALADAEAMADRAEAEGNVSELLLLRRAQVRVLVGRGQTGPARPLADWLVEAARESGGTEEVLGAFTAAAGGLLAAGEPDRALELLAEAAAWPHAAEASLYPACLPEMARTATDAGDPTLAQRLVAPLEPTFAYHQYALCAAGAVLAEARGRFAEAAARHGEAADRWGSFGVVPERAHALLGRGRCLVALGRPGGREPLLQARQVFAGLRAQPLAAEADALLGRAGTRA